jgi:hypothetical protein
MTSPHITPVDHIYVNFPNQNSLAATGSGLPVGTYPVMAPADGRIVSVEDFRASNQYPYPDYRVVIEHSCDFYSVFIHVGALQGVAKAAENGGNWHGSIPIKAGEVFADDSDHPGFDFSTFDGTHKLALANLASYAQAESWKPYTADPFKYFPTDVRAAMDAKSLRTAEPFGGRIDWDLTGTARGNWFQKGTNGYRGLGSPSASFNNHGKIAHGYWDTHLAMAPEAVDNTAFLYSIGDWAGCPCQFMATNNLDPSTIVPSDHPTVIELVEPVFELPDGAPMKPPEQVKGYKVVPGSQVVGVLAIQLNADGSLTVEKMPGATSAAAFKGFTNNALTYVR